jgi:hypothetical protein
VSDALAEAHTRRWSALYTDLNLWLPTWQDITELCLPRKSNVTLRRTPGRTQTERMSDSTAAHAIELLSASMQGSLTSGSIRWFYYRIRGLQYGKDVETDQWLEITSNMSYDELKQSNFNSEAHEFYTDLASVGTAAMFIERKDPRPGQPWQGVRFKTLPPGTYAVDENEDGVVDTLYYKYTLTARQAAEKFTLAKLPDIMKRQLLSGQEPDRKFDFVNGIFPRKDKWADARGSQITPKAWASLHFSLDEPTTVKEGGYEEFPFAVGRWTKSSDEKYGRSPAFTVLADVKTLNKLVELKLRALANKVLPPMLQRDNGVLGGIKLYPGGGTIVRDMEAVKPLMTDNGGIEAGMLQEDRLQTAVRRGFFADQLQLQDGPQMTATEVQVRYELMQRILGPTLGRLEVEFLEPVISRVYKMLERAKRLPEPTAWMAKQNAKFDVEYEGPLQRAQRLGDVVSTQRFLQVAIPLSELDPEVTDNLDSDKLFRLLGRDTGASPTIFRSEKDRDERRAARRKQQADQQAAAQSAEQMKAMGAGAPALKALVEAQQQGILPQGGMTANGPVTGGVGK